MLWEPPVGVGVDCKSATVESSLSLSASVSSHISSPPVKSTRYTLCIAGFCFGSLGRFLVLFLSSVLVIGKMTTGGQMVSLKELPVGYRFNPSDEVLLNYHLKRKLSNIEEEYCLIPEFDIYKLPPWDLITKFNDLSDLAYDGRECFFYHRRSDPNSQRNNRRTPEGFWKDTGGNQKPRVTNQTKWLKKILVYRLGKQGSAVKTDWAMHEYQDISNPSIVVCRMHKSKPKKVKERVASGSSKACSSGSCRATASSKTQTEPPELSPETPVNTTTESQSPTDTNIPEYCTSFPKQTQVDTERSLSLSEGTYSDSIHLTDLKDPQSPQILMREQLPSSKNVFIDGCDQENGNWSYLPHVTTEDGGNMVVVYETPNNQLSNYELPGFVSPPQHPQKMPTEGISPSITNSELDIHGWVAQLPVVSLTHGAQETYFKELQMPQELSSIYNINPSSDSSGRGGTNAFHFGGERLNCVETQDFATEPPAAAQSSDINSLLDSFFASPLQSILNSQTPIPPPKSYLRSPVDMRMLPELSTCDMLPELSICNMLPSSDSSEGGNQSACHFDESFEPQQTNLEVTQDFASESLAAAQFSDINSLLDSFFVSPLQCTLNPPTPIPPPKSYLPSPEEMQMLPELSSIHNMHPSFNSFEGGNPSAFHFDDSNETWQTNLEVIQDFATEAPVATQSSDINSLLDSFFVPPPQSFLNSETPILPAKRYLRSPEEMQMLGELSSICNMHPSSDSSEGGNPSVFHVGKSIESQQTNLEVTGDFANESSAATQSSDINSLLDSFFASPLPPTSNSQALIPPPNSYLPFPEEMQMLPNLSSVCNMHTSLDSFEGGNPRAFHFGESHESQQTNLQVTQDFATELPDATQFSEINPLLDPFFAPPLQSTELPDATQFSEINPLLDPFFAPPLQSTLNSQTPIPPPNCHLLSPEAMQKLQELICNIHPSSVSSGGGSPNAIHFGECDESQQTNLEVTRDFATESSDATQYLDIDSMLDSFFASPELPEAEMEESSPCSISIVPGGYGAEYHGVPDASGGPVRTKQS